MKKRHTLLTVLTFITILFSSKLLSRAKDLQATPDTFDFGWCPDNAKVSAEYTLKNIGPDILPLQSLQPTCGCTAGQFTPANLGTNEEKKIGLTFNTQGYKGLSFHKTAKVKTDDPTEELTVNLAGRVADPSAQVAPLGTGIADFTPGSERTQVITFQNKTDKELSLAVVQAPAEWARVVFYSEKIKPTSSMNTEVKVSGSLEEMRNTSVTIEAVGDVSPHRFTIAIRTGPPPAVYVPLQPPPPSASPQATPKKEEKPKDAKESKPKPKPKSKSK
ncbi:MAG: DUF1573 domain-containing protein [Elusimicrobia bacterium]|nr:DUF1573 domain-containing protein [Candidatus Obscuribacterium magneticum]